MIKKTNGFFTKTRILLMIVGLFATPLITSAQYYYNNYNYPSNPLFVTTNNATFVTPNSATLNGTVSGNTNNLSIWFEYGTTPNFGLSTSHFNYNFTNTNTSATIGSLSPATVYYFRAVAQNTWGVVYGNTNSFRTDFGGGYVTTDIYNPYTAQYAAQNTQPANLTAITSTATLIGTRSVDLNALIINTPASPANTWFEWGTNYNLSNQTPVVTLGTLREVKHVSTITELASGTTYYFRAVAINNMGQRSNGVILSFTTKAVATTPAPEAVAPKDTIEETKVGRENLSASAIGSGNFLPDSALEWVILAILVAVLVILARNLYIKK